MGTAPRHGCHRQPDTNPNLAVPVGTGIALRTVYAHLICPAAKGHALPLLQTRPGQEENSNRRYHVFLEQSELSLDSLRAGVRTARVSNLSVAAGKSSSTCIYV